MPPKTKPNKDTFTATIGFEATALRDGAFPPREAILRSLSAEKDNRWLAADSQGEAEPERSGDSPARFLPNKPGQTATGSPKGERGGANQYFLTRFASAEGKNGGQWSGATLTETGCPQGERGGVHQFYTPSCVARCLVEMLAPYTALRGIEADFGPEHANTFRRDLHPDLRADTATRVSE